jgi:hypothetical protein
MKAAILKSRRTSRFGYGSIQRSDWENIAHAPAKFSVEVEGREGTSLL